MSPLTLLFIAFGLSMDAFAVAVASGIAIRDLRLRHALRIALFFGGFQALMPVVGWLAGGQLREHIAAYDHWVAMLILSFIGGKMISEGLMHEEEEPGPDSGHLPLDVLTILAIATSIDALAVGVSLSFLGVSIAAPALVIGAVTFAVSLGGVLLGDRLGGTTRPRAEIAGGAVLVGIGLKILLEHLPAKA